MECSKMIKQDSFRLMREDDLATVKRINTDFEITDSGAREYITRSGAYVLCDCGEVVGYVFFRVEKGNVAVDRIGASESRQYAQLLIAMFYLCEELVGGVHTLAVRFQSRNKMLCHELKMSNFFFVKEEAGVSIFAKIVHESTWREGTFYRQGGMVIEEILHGEGRVLGR